MQRNSSISNTPIGPFHTTVPADSIREAKSASVRGSMSKTAHPSGMRSRGTVRVLSSSIPSISGAIDFSVRLLRAPFTAAGVTYPAGVTLAPAFAWRDGRIQTERSAQ